jgi:hypothetical protein
MSKRRENDAQGTTVQEASVSDLPALVHAQSKG